MRYTSKMLEDTDIVPWTFRSIQSKAWSSCGRRCGD